MKSGGHGVQIVKILNEVDESFVKIYYIFPFQDSDYLRLANHLWFDGGVQEFRFNSFQISVVLRFVCLFLRKHAWPRRGTSWHFPVGNDVNNEPFVMTSPPQFETTISRLGLYLYL